VAELPEQQIADQPPERRFERFFQYVFMLALVAGCLTILLPFFTAILFSMVIAISTWPYYRWLKGKLRGAVPAALVGCLAVTLLIIGPAVLLSLSGVQGVAWLSDAARGWFANGPPPPPEWLLRIPWFGDDLQATWRRLASNTGELQQLLARYFEPLRHFAVSAGKVFGAGLLQIGFAIFLLFFMYRDGERLGGWLQTAAQRIAGPPAMELVETGQNTIVGVMIGVLGTALAQAMVAALGFLVAGVPGAILLATLTFVLSMVPVGPPLVWGGAAIWLFNQGQPGWAVFMVVYGLFAISAVDNVIKPYLISRSSHLPFALTLMGVIGGVLSFGFMGVFIGPTLLALAISIGGRWLAPPPAAAPASPQGAEGAGRAVQG